MRRMQSPGKSGTIESRPAREGSPNERRHKSAQAFILRVILLTALIASVAYGAWFAPWARPVHTLDVETIRPPGADAAKQETGRADTVTPEKEQPDTRKPDTRNSGTGGAATRNPATVKADTGKAETVHPGVGRGQPGKAEMGHEESVRARTGGAEKMDTRKPETDQPVDNGN
jgi:hypothetical protein